jgi:CspA family cold shock protein
MNYRDTLVTCEECGKQFIVTVEKQRQMAERGEEVVIPTWCDACTQRGKFGGKLHGRIKWFNLEKGYGFILEDSGKELFFHRSGVPLSEDGTLPALDENLEVLYQVTDSPRGPQAVQVVPYTGGEA